LQFWWDKAGLKGTRVGPVKIERFYLGCLAHASYAVSSEQSATIIDPQRDVDIYLEAAARQGWKIEHIIETHLHADFVSGHRELADRTGARVYLGAGSGAEFPHVAVSDGQEIQFGQCRLRFLHTPGHTLESICVLMTDLGQPQRPQAVFTGDTLFIGDVGRPDLSPTHTPQELATILYRSIHEKLLTLPDDTEIFPAHGAGSLCGRQMSSESASTIGEQRKSNYALLARTAEEFVHLLTDDLPARPEYFAREVDLNRRGAAPLSELPPLAALTALEVLRLQQEGAVVLDTRPVMQFAVAHVTASVHVALTGQYASWAARIVGLDTRLVIVGEGSEHVRESQLRLARVGVENLAGYLAEGVSGWIETGLELESLPQMAVQELAELRERDHISLLDVRERAEVSGGAIRKSVRIPLGELQARTGELDREKLQVVHCQSGYRSSIASSLLRRAGFCHVANLTGGFGAWKTAGLPYVVPGNDGD
jgi:glyoxylase-like metal-dependent hydrolase (beta-lactamase superfamily II)/rhodanese-related sulfurtransferase